MTLNEAEIQWNDAREAVATAAARIKIATEQHAEAVEQAEKARLRIRAIMLRLQVIAGGADE